MPERFPAVDFAQKLQKAESADNSPLSSSVSVSDVRYGIVFKLWVDLDVASETDLENLPDSLTVSITIGSTVWSVRVHPLVEHTDANSIVHRTVDLGPWAFNFPRTGLYSGTLGDDIVVAVGAAGTDVKSRVNILYAD